MRARGYRFIAGADEVGRGSLFGAVVAAAVILSADSPIRGLQRQQADRSRSGAKFAWPIAVRRTRRCVGCCRWSDACMIDRINIYQASRLTAMKQAVLQLSPSADFVLVDAVPLDLGVPQQPLIQGDERCHADRSRFHHRQGFIATR